VKLAVILAAGMGRRMGDAGELRPKSLTEVGGTTIARNTFEQLCRVGFERVVVVTGHLSEQLIEHLAPFEERLEILWVHNPDYATTNNAYSLWLAREHLGGGFHLFEADVMFAPSLLDGLVDCPHEDVALVDPFREPMNGTVVTLDEGGAIQAMILGRDQKAPTFSPEGTYKTINIYRFGARYASEVFLPELDARVAAGKLGDFYEIALRDTLAPGTSLHGLVVSPARWWEVDTMEDAEIAREMFPDPGRDRS
jgi:choline kinase